MDNRAPTWHEPPLAEVDPEISTLILEEERREAETVRLIASENYVSRAVLEASGSVLTNKYSEGYPRKRYYEGQQSIDPVEELACERVKKLFGMDHVNVQPYSGSPANLAVYLATVQPGDTVMGLGLPSGGHLTHGHNVSITGRYFKSIPYGLRASDDRMTRFAPSRANIGRSSFFAEPRPTRASSISRRSPTSLTRSARFWRRTSPTSPGSSWRAFTLRRPASPTW